MKITLPFATTDTTLPKDRVDPVLADSGSLFLFDAKSPKSWGLTSIGSNTTWKNLVSGGTNATLERTNALLFDSSIWGFSNDPSIGTNVSTAGRIDLGAKYFTNKANNYLLVTWITLPVSTTSYAANGTPWLWYSSNAAGGGTAAATKALEIQASNTGTAIQSYVWGTFVSGSTPAALQNSGQISQSGSIRTVQYAINWYKDSADNLWKLRTFLNNSQLGIASYSPVVSDTFGINDPGSNNVRALGSVTNSGFKIHRLYAEDLTTSGRTPQTVLGIDWAYAQKRFRQAS